jgi:hypothetical protein
MFWFRRGDHPEEQLSSYLDGELSARQSQAVERHLADCGACAALLEELRAAKTMLSSLPRRTPPRSFVLGPEYARERPAPRPRWSSMALAPAAAMSLFLALVAVDLGAFSSGDSGADMLTMRSSEMAENDAPAPMMAPVPADSGQPGAALEDRSATEPPSLTGDEGEAGTAEAPEFSREDGTQTEESRPQVGTDDSGSPLTLLRILIALTGAAALGSGWYVWRRGVSRGAI